jgi:hypothetical protein
MAAGDTTVGSTPGPSVRGTDLHSLRSSDTPGVEIRDPGSRSDSRLVASAASNGRTEHDGIAITCRARAESWPVRADDRPVGQRGHVLDLAPAQQARVARLLLGSDAAQGHQRRDFDQTRTEMAPIAELKPGPRCGVRKNDHRGFPDTMSLAPEPRGLYMISRRIQFASLR